MKICFLGDARSVHIQRLACGLVASGHTVHVVTHKPADIPGVSVERFAVPTPGLTNPRGWAGRRTHYLQTILSRFDVTNVHFLADWGLTPEIMNAGCVVATAWGSDIDPPPGEGLPSPELTAARVSLLRHAQAVTTCGPTFADSVARYAELELDRIDVVPFGVDLDLFGRSTPLRSSRAGGPQHVGFFKGFREVYGPTDLIRAIPRVLDRVPNVRFELVGDGAQLDECRNIATRLGVSECVEWIPRQPHSAIPTYLSRWDLTVIPSVCEAFGVAALESSASGVPVVASDVGGLRDTVLDGRTGLLVPPRSPAALADAISTLLLDDLLRTKMGAVGAGWVKSVFDQRVVVKKWVALYERVREESAAMV